MGVVILFHWEEAVGVEGYWMDAIIEFLHNDGS